LLHPSTQSSPNCGHPGLLSETLAGSLTSPRLSSRKNTAFPPMASLLVHAKFSFSNAIYADCCMQCSIYSSTVNKTLENGDGRTVPTRTTCFRSQGDRPRSLQTIALLAPLAEIEVSDGGRPATSCAGWPESLTTSCESCIDSGCCPTPLIWMHMRPEVGKHSRLPRNSESTCFFPGTIRKHC
jgi:hypothetical protein